MRISEIDPKSKQLSEAVKLNEWMYEEGDHVLFGDNASPAIFKGYVGSGRKSVILIRGKIFKVDTEALSPGEESFHADNMVEAAPEDMQSEPPSPYRAESIPRMKQLAGIISEDWSSDAGPSEFDTDLDSSDW